MLLRIQEINELASDITSLSNEDGLEILNEEYSAAVFSPVKVGRALEIIKRKAKKITIITLKIAKYYREKEKISEVIIQWKSLKKMEILDYN